MGGAPPFFDLPVGYPVIGRTVILIGAVAALLVAMFAIAVLGKRLRTDSPQAGVIAGMTLDSVESPGPDGGAAYSVVIGMEGDRKIEVPVRFIAAPGAPPITPAQARTAMHVWIRKRAIEIGRMSRSDVEHKPTIYVSMDD